MCNQKPELNQKPDKNAPIGVFDSGVGGLTVAREIMRQMPDNGSSILEIRRGFLMEANPRTPSSATPDRSSAF